MAKTIVDTTGQLRTIDDSRRQKLLKQYDLMEEALRKGEVHFTKKTLVKMYGLSSPDVWNFIKEMERRSVLAKDVPIQTRGYSEERWYIIDRPPVVGPVSATKQPTWMMATPRGGRRLLRRLQYTSVCDRCGSHIPGKGRHAKSSRGHTTEICDLAMVKVIQES